MGQTAILSEAQLLRRHHGNNSCIRLGFTPSEAKTPIFFQTPQICTSAPLKKNLTLTLEFLPISISSHVDVEGLQDAPVHQLPDARDDPGRPPARGQIHGLRPPHEPRPRRLRGVPQATPGQVRRQEPGRQGRRPGGPPDPRPRPPPRRGGRLHDRRGPSAAGRRQIPRRGPRHLRPRRPRCRPSRRQGDPHRPARPGPARPRRPCTRHRRAHPRHDAAPDRPPARLLPAPHAPAGTDAAWLPWSAPSPNAGPAWPDAHADDEARRSTPATWALPDAAAVWAEADGASAPAAAAADDEARYATAASADEARDARGATAAQTGDATHVRAAAEARDAAATAQPAGAEPAGAAVELDCLGCALFCDILDLVTQFYAH